MGTEEEYNEFYKGISKDYLDPLAYTHFNAEGEIEFKSILFLPKKAPFDMMDNYWTKKIRGETFRAPCSRGGQIRGLATSLPELCTRCRRFRRFTFECLSG